jgi:hypothetical protein
VIIIIIVIIVVVVVIVIIIIMIIMEARSSVVVKALCYKPEGRGFDTQCGECIFFSIYIILPAALGPGVYPASNRNEYQKH